MKTGFAHKWLKVSLELFCCNRFDLIHVVNMVSVVDTARRALVTLIKSLPAMYSVTVALTRDCADAIHFVHVVSVVDIAKRACDIY